MNFKTVFLFLRMLKKELRKLYERKRSELSAEDVDDLSASIVKRFSAISLQDIRYLHVFYPIVGKHEFNSLLLVQDVKQRYRGIRLVLSKSDLKNHTLKNFLWTEETILAMNQWGITEPESGREIQASEIDMVIIPLLAFDLKGNRLGYGKGFYDRFLSECRTDVKKVGISFFHPEEVIETEAHDIPLDICITPDDVWTFKTGVYT